MADDRSGPGSGEAEQIAWRREKLARLRGTGWEFPNDFRRSRNEDGTEHDSAVLQAAYGEVEKDALEQRAIPVALAGRLVNRRGPFLVIQDGAGQIQFYLAKDADPALKEIVEGWDVGDIVAGRGTLQKSGRGALYLFLEEARLLTKALRPLPDQYYGVADTELRYRRRYLDLIMNEESRNTFRTRSAIVREVRTFMEEHGFMEVETPMMQVIPGGAAAKPFVTHHNALDLDLYLRIAPELYLKRLTVGGFERVYEINRNFRNEGLSTRHNPEFTMLEFYWAYADYTELMDMTEQMLRRLCERVLGSTTISYQGEAIDFGRPIPRVTVRDSLVQYAELDPAIVDDREALGAWAARHGLDVEAGEGLGSLQFRLFEELVEERITQPVFIVGYPTEVSPLSRRNDANPEITDRFELFVMGREIANGFSELNDAEDQAERFREQVARKDAGDDEAMHYDADYVTALEYGLPPTAGEGIGIDRLVMLLTDSASIRDVLLFPHLRPRQEES
ncbi:MAG: lysine--tRNA ligase [Pseudomonadales bacterium]|jgi:lysyl-tRNA synthetase class 2|nr:lysine--tRNA ligase [Pseudomonadales bacterium]